MQPRNIPQTNVPSERPGGANEFHNRFSSQRGDCNIRAVSRWKALDQIDISKFSACLRQSHALHCGDTQLTVKFAPRGVLQGNYGALLSNSELIFRLGDALKGRWKYIQYLQQA